MTRMKKAWMLQGVRTGKYLLEESDEFWFPYELSDTDGGEDEARRDFMIFRSKKEAESFAKLWNSRQDHEAVKVVPVIAGFIELEPGDEIVDEIDNDLVWRRDVYRMLYGIGGTGADENSWADGWDKAIEQAIENLKKLESV